jgi:hypothetical protein
VPEIPFIELTGNVEASRFRWSEFLPGDELGLVATYPLARYALGRSGAETAVTVKDKQRLRIGTYMIT